MEWVFGEDWSGSLRKRVLSMKGRRWGGVWILSRTMTELRMIWGSFSSRWEIFPWTAMTLSTNMREEKRSRTWEKAMSSMVAVSSSKVR